VQTYRNDAVQADIARHLDTDTDTAGDRFRQMLQWLDQNAAVGPPVSPTFEVDVAWHAFILHTRDYTNYCMERFGHYVHHEPGVEPSAPGLADCIKLVVETSTGAAPAGDILLRS